MPLPLAPTGAPERPNSSARYHSATPPSATVAATATPYRRARRVRSTRAQSARPAIQRLAYVSPSAARPSGGDDGQRAAGVAQKVGEQEGGRGDLCDEQDLRGEQFARLRILRRERNA